MAWSKSTSAMFVRNLTTFLLAFLVLVFLFTNVEALGKCTAFPYFGGDYLGGLDHTVCTNILQEAGYTHYWAESDDVPGGPFPVGTDPLTSSCLKETFYVYEAPTQRLLNGFSPVQPSGLCQNILLVASCLKDIKVCDPMVDIDTYVTEEKHKPCHWTCDIIKSNFADFCTSVDITYLGTIGVNLADNSYFDCDSPRYSPPDTQLLEFSDGTTACIAPQFISDEPPAAHCEEYNDGGVCGSLFPYGTSVFIPGGTTQERIEADLQRAIFVLNSLPRLEFSTCVEDTLRLYCQSVFQECLGGGVQRYKRDHATGGVTGQAPTPTTMALPLPPPIQTCRSFVDNCSNTPLWGAYLASIGATALADCDNDHYFNTAKCISTVRTSLPTPGSSYRWNTQNYIKPYGYSNTGIDGPDGDLYVATSFGATAGQSIQYLPYTDCPPPLVLADDHDSGLRTIFGTTSAPTRCTFPCPSPAYSDNERKGIDAASWIFIMISLIAAVILALTFSVFHSQRHKHLLFWYVLTYAITAFFLFLGLVVRSDGSLWKAQCATPTDYQHMKGFGLFQGIMLVYFMCTSTNFWMMLAIDLYQRLILGLTFRRGSAPDFTRKVAMHIFSWGSPCFTVAAILLAGQFGYDNNDLPFAWITMDPDANLSSRYSLTWIFFIHIIACILVGLVLVLIILVFLIRYTDPNAKSNMGKLQNSLQDDSTSVFFKIKQILKLLGFVLLVVPFFVILVIRHIYVSSNLDQWSLARDEWGRDLILTLGNTGINFFTGLPTASLESRMPPGISILTVFAFSSPGFIMFILYFILSADVYGLWIHLTCYSCLGIECCEKWAKKDTTTGSNATGSSAGSSSGGSTGSDGSARTGHSNDLFSGGVLLTKRARDKAAQSHADDHSAASAGSATITPPTGSAANKSNTNSGVGSAVGSGGSHTTETMSTTKTPARRGTLFKGFSKPTQDMRAINNSRRASQYTDSQSDVELINLQISDPEQHEKCRTDIGAELGADISEENQPSPCFEIAECEDESDN